MKITVICLWKILGFCDRKLEKKLRENNVFGGPLKLLFLHKHATYSNTAHMSFERGYGVLQPHGELFQFMFLHFDFLELLISLTKKKLIF